MELFLVPKTGTADDFRKHAENSFNLGDMRVLCLSHENEFHGHVQKIFSDRIADLRCVTDPEQFLTSGTTGDWDIFLIDFDALQGDEPNPVQFVQKLAPKHPPLVIVSSRFATWHHQLQQMGALILHKPTAIGEVGLALRKLAADARQNPHSYLPA